MFMAALAVGATAAGLWGSSKASKEAKKAQEEANRINAMMVQLQREQFEWTKGKYEQWEAMFGPLKNELSDYYANMTADNYIRRLELARDEADNQLVQQFTQARKDIQAQLARNGMAGGAASVAAGIQLAGQQNSLKNANALTTELQKTYADDYVYGQKTNWMNLGMSEQSLLINAMQNSNANTANAMANQANAYANQASSYRQQASASMGMAFQGLGMLAGMGDSWLSSSGSGSGTGAGTGGSPFSGVGYNATYGYNYTKLPQTSSLLGGM